MDDIMQIAQERAERPKTAPNGLRKNIRRGLLCFGNDGANGENLRCCHIESG